MGRSMHRTGRRVIAMVAITALTWGQVAPAQLLRGAFSGCARPAACTVGWDSCGPATSWEFACPPSGSFPPAGVCTPSVAVAEWSCGSCQPGWVSPSACLPRDGGSCDVACGGGCASGCLWQGIDACPACDGVTQPLVEGDSSCPNCQVDAGPVDLTPPTEAPAAGEKAADAAPIESPAMEAPSAIVPGASVPPAESTEDSAQDPLFGDLFPSAPPAQVPPAQVPPAQDPAAVDLPVTEPPVAEAPVEDDAQRSQPAEDEFVPDDLLFDDPAVDEAMPQEPALEDPPADESTPEDPLFDDPALDDVLPEEPAAQPPAQDDSLFDDSLFDEPAATEPAATEPVADEPVAEEGLIDEGAMSEPADEGGVDDLFGGPADDTLPTEPAPATDAEPADATPAVETPQAPEAEDDLNLDDLFGADRPALRTWTDNTGAFQVEAALHEMGDQHVRLLKANGKFCTVPYHRLSARDFALVQAYAQQMGRPAPLRLATR